MKSDKFCLLICFSVATLSGAIFVTKDECPPNEEYLLCGSACPFNCSNPEGPVVCTDDCVEGCFCKNGYLRGENGTCVNADECGKNTSICEDNEEFQSCGTACPATCAAPAPLGCGVVACSMGCFCKAGYVRDEITGICVTVDNCTVAPCPKDEVYDVCAADCEPSCLDPEPLCAKVCASGCICSSGLLRSEDGTCVSVDKCPPRNGTEGVFGRYLDMIDKIMHLSSD